MKHSLLRLVLAALAVLALVGCAGTGYYWQSLQGHLALLNAARPLPEWIAEPHTPPPLRQRLELAERARRFGVTELALPDNASYTRYAAIDRSAAVWNVVAAPPFSLQLHRWCFPVTGCIGYRGYFNEAEARAEAARLAATGLEVSVYGVPAYSTLGYSNWLGGDPLLSTWITWPEGDFVQLMLHELAHQEVYASGDTAFNESYATAVGRLGTLQWLKHYATPAALQAYEASETRRREWRALTRSTREQLALLYASNSAVAHDHQALSAMKNEVFASFRTAYAGLRAHWQAQGSTAGQLAALDRWVQDANNASFGTQAAYEDLVPAFTALFEREGRDWPRFHAAVKALAQLPASERLQRLQRLQGDVSRAATQ